MARFTNLNVWHQARTLLRMVSDATRSMRAEARSQIAIATGGNFGGQQHLGRIRTRERSGISSVSRHRQCLGSRSRSPGDHCE